jgi:hypothetical protein
MSVAAASNAIISLAEVKDFLAIPTATTTDDDFLQTWVNYQSSAIEETGIFNKVKVQDISGEILNGNGRTKIRTNYFPITAIGVAASTTDALKLASVQDWDDATDAWTNIETDIDNILIHTPVLAYASAQNPHCLELLETIFPEGTQNIKLSYQAGWSTIPTNLVIVCLELVAGLYRDSGHMGGGRFGLQSTSINEGGGSKNVQYKDFSARHLKLMEPYKRKF